MINWIRKKLNLKMRIETSYDEELCINIFISLTEDFKNRTGFDYIETLKGDNGHIFYYYFENGDIFKMYNSTAIFTNKEKHIKTKFRLSYDTSLSLINAINKIIGIQRDEYNRKHNRSYNRKQTKTNVKLKTNVKPKPVHPKRERYNVLLSTISQRRKNYNKLSDNSPEKESLGLELNSAIRRAKSMKEKYNF